MLLHPFCRRVGVIQDTSKVKDLPLPCPAFPLAGCLYGQTVICSFSFSPHIAKCTDELKQRAVEFVRHARAAPDTSRRTVTRIANEFGVSREALWVWE